MICFPLDDTLYEAKDLGAWFVGRTRGVFSAGENLAVHANTGMSIRVSPGVAWLKMRDAWGVVAHVEQAQSFTLELPHAQLARIDAVCVQLDKNLNEGRVCIKKGEDAISPVVTPPVRDDDFDEIYVATVRVAAGVIEILPANITDTRLDEALCGVMRDGVSEIPTNVLQEQAQSMIAQTGESAQNTLELIEEELSRLNASSEVMLKTEYAPDAVASVVSGGVLQVVSAYTHPQNNYEVRFTMPGGYSGGSITIDGVTMSALLDMQGDGVTLSAAQGAPVSLMRRQNIAYLMGGGTNLDMVEQYVTSYVPTYVSGRLSSYPTSATLGSHTLSRSNPHGVTAAQTGATTLSAVGTYVSGQLANYVPQSGARFTGNAFAVFRQNYAGECLRDIGVADTAGQFVGTSFIYMKRR